MSQSCFHAIITGHVQGVWFRASTQEKARALGLTGWVKNLPDGTVECMACGDDAALDALTQWIQRGGPPGASVDKTDIEQHDWQLFSDFIIER